MSIKRDKTMPLAEAVKKYVKDGCHISVGGFTLNRNPMAAVYEIIRAGIKDLHLYAHSNGQAVDELIGARCLRRLEIAYSGVGKTAATCIRFRLAAERGHLEIEDYSNYMMALRFQAGAMGVPFLPCLSGFGSHITTRWGFSREVRATDPALPNHKLVVMDNPFEGWTGARKVLCVPAINPDVTIIHAQRADKDGNVSIAGLTFLDVEQAKASKAVIVTCEEIVETSVLRADPDRVQIPFIYTSAVCLAPHGAYPTACYRRYDYDPRYLRDYADAARDDGAFAAFQKRHIYDLKGQKDLLEFVGKERLDAIKADPVTGYAVGLKRD